MSETAQVGTTSADANARSDGRPKIKQFGGHLAIAVLDNGFAGFKRESLRTLSSPKYIH